MNIQTLGSYGYDEADNLTLLDDDSGFSHFTHDSGNAVVEQSGDMAQRWVVDAAGQTREDAWNYYGWDSAGQLLGVKNKYSGLRTDFERDAQGRLIGSVSATERHAYLWCDEYTPCARVNAHGQIDALYYGQGEVSAAAPYHRYYARDHLGSVRAMVDAQGEVIGRQDYSAYGSVVAQSGLMPSVGYAGMWQHHDSGINLTWYRGYQPAAGRWLSRDPIEEQGGLNLFGYVGGNPLSNVDPMGLSFASVVSDATGGCSSNSLADDVVNNFVDVQDQTSLTRTGISLALGGTFAKQYGGLTALGAAADMMRDSRAGFTITGVGSRTFLQAAATGAATWAVNGVLIKGSYDAGVLAGSALRAAINRAASAAACTCKN